MKKIRVAENLTDNEYALFLQVYARHNSAMGLEKRKDYTLSDIVKVEWNEEEDCLHVYYKDGEWWHYCKDGTWY